ncbi:MAG: GFA family protein [Granulosicoccus sp.]
MSEPKSGQCVCGEVSYTISGEPKRVTICHCQWCQRRTGSAFGVEVVFEASQIHINEDLVSRYRHISDETGRWIDQHYCSKCGSNIGLTLEVVPDIRSIAAGTFDDPSWLQAEKYHRSHVFTHSAQDWTDIPADVERHDGYFR